MAYSKVRWDDIVIVNRTSDRRDLFSQYDSYDKNVMAFFVVYLVHHSSFEKL